MRIIPAIDLLDSKCVRLAQGDYSARTTYSEDPVEVARQFAGAGIRYLHVVDLDGAKSGRLSNLPILEKIIRETGLKVDFGGGIRSRESLEQVLNAGVSQVTLGSIAVKSPEEVTEWLEIYGPETLILGADCKNRKIATHGWKQSSALDVVTFLSEYFQQGFSYAIVTDIARDGMLEGPALDLYEEILDQIPAKLIASGGIRSIGDLQALAKAGCEGAIIGKAIYENKITLAQLSELC